MSKRISIQDCKQFAQNKGGKCLSDEYEYYIKLLWQCEFGHQWTAIYDNIKQNHWCPECTKKKKHTIEDCRQLAAQKNGKCLSERYINNKVGLLWECSERHQWRVCYKSVDRGHWCSKCSSGKSQKQLYDIVKKIFPDYCIFYDFMGFEWLGYWKNRQEIDIFISELKVAIEYDGRQHFESIDFWGGKKAFEKTKNLDEQKNRRISTHPEDVKTFIRIPYWEKITEENVKRILRENEVI